MEAAKAKLRCDLVVTLYFTQAYFDLVAATLFVDHKPNISTNKMYSDDQLLSYNDLIADVRGSLLSYGFVIDKEYQSNLSYAYYIEFFPTDENDEILPHVVRVKIRIGDHSNLGMDSTSTEISPPGKAVLRSFELGGARYPNEVALLNAIWGICDGLQQGDYSVLDKY